MSAFYMIYDRRYTSDLGSWSISITRATRYVDAAWRLVAYTAGPVGAAQNARLAGRTPARPIQLSWLSKTVINPGIYPDILMATTSRVVALGRQDLQRIIDGELNTVWANQAEPKTAVGEISRRIRAFLEENPH
jgi:ABC-type glycerol-3-phosphate transport system substrate-binding protein